MNTESLRNQIAVVEYYSNTNYPERDRFDDVLGELEFTRTCEVLERHLPPSGAIIADVGGGPGAYARWMLERGYNVRLIDPVPRHIQEAKEMFAQLHAGERAQAVVGNAVKLPYEDDSVDAVLLFGPMYHLASQQDRMQALQEALRVVKSGGYVFAAGISRFASLIDGLCRGFLWDPIFQEIVRQDLADGQHNNPTGNFDYFTDAHFHQPDELVKEIQGAGFVDVRVLAVEGPLWADPNLAQNWKDKSRLALLLELAKKVEEEPALTGASPHLLAISRKP